MDSIELPDNLLVDADFHSASSSFSNSRSVTAWIKHLKPDCNIEAVDGLILYAITNKEEKLLVEIMDKFHRHCVHEHNVGGLFASGDRLDAILFLMDVQSRISIYINWIPHPLIPYEICSEGDDSETLKTMLDKQPDLLNSVVADGIHGNISLLHVLCSRDWKDSVRCLFEVGANPHVFDDKCPLLSICISETMREIVLRGIENYAVNYPIASSLAS